MSSVPSRGSFINYVDKDGGWQNVNDTKYIGLCNSKLVNREERGVKNPVNIVYEWLFGRGTILQHFDQSVYFSFIEGPILYCKL